MRALVAILVVVTATSARADAPDDPSPDTALWVSLGTTAAGTVAVAAGVILAGHHRGAAGGLLLFGSTAVLVGPSLGHLYAGDLRVDGLGLRLTALLGTAAVLLIGGMGECPHESCDFPREVPVTATLAAAGLASLAASAVWDIVTAPAAARRHRTRLVPSPGGLAFVSAF